MATALRDVMAKDPVALPADTPLVDAARSMKEKDIGDVIVLDGDEMCGVVTDRDIVVRAVAEGRDPSDTKLGDVCSHDVVTLSPDASIDDAVKIMREKAIRRIPVEEDGKPVGIVSLGDVATERNPNSIVADISEKGANN
jgi:CBS domain-containing protein